MSNEKIEPPFTENKRLSPKLVLMNNSEIRLRFTGSCLRQEFATFNANNVVNLFIMYELDRWSQEFNLKDSLLGAVKLTKNANPDKYFYSGCGIGFDSRSLISFPNFDKGKNVIISGADMSSSVHANSKNKDILFLSKGQAKGLDNTSLTAEAGYSINFSRSERKNNNGKKL